MPFTEARDAIAAAAYIEQLHATEQHWLTNRLTWLVLSQSFIIAAYVDLITSEGPSRSLENVQRAIEIMKWALPAIGLFTCLVVGMAVHAAHIIASNLADQRAQLCREINRLANLEIPLLGGSSRNRPHDTWTLRAGKLPQYLPWVLAALWASLFFSISITLKGPG